MFNSMTIWTKNNEVRKFIVLSISIYVVNVKNSFLIFITTFIAKFFVNNMFYLRIRRSVLGNMWFFHIRRSVLGNMWFFHTVSTTIFCRSGFNNFKYFVTMKAFNLFNAFPFSRFLIANGRTIKTFAYFVSCWNAEKRFFTYCTIFWNLIAQSLRRTGFAAIFSFSHIIRRNVKRCLTDLAVDCRSFFVFPNPVSFYVNVCHRSMI